jgi:type I restriction enzyme, R subunit
MKVSQNFAFLNVYSSELVRLGSLAEQYFLNDPNTCLIKLRQFGELLAQQVAAKVGLYEDPNESQVELLRRLENRQTIIGKVAQLFHEVRKVGNQATHGKVAQPCPSTLHCAQLPNHCTVMLAKAQGVRLTIAFECCTE